MTATAVERSYRPQAALGLATLLWGTSWIPMRSLDALGLAPDRALVGLNLPILLALAPLVWTSRRRWIPGWRALALVGLTGGVSLTCFYLAVTMTTVARATLLFYLAPVWTVLIRLGADGRGPTRPELAGIGLGLAGVAVIVEGADGGNTTVGAGDGLALAAGILFAISSYTVHARPHLGTPACTWVWALGQLVSALVAVALSIHHDPSTVLPAAWWLIPCVVALGLLMFLPMSVLTLWAAGRMGSTQVTLFLMGEVVVAVASAAWLTNDPFELREASGCGLIIAACGLGLRQPSR